MSSREASSNPERTSRIATYPLLAGLLMVAVLAPCRLQAQTNRAKALPSSNRWLLIVDTSRSMQRRADAALQTVQVLLTSGMSGQLRRGDTLGIWTYNEGFYAGRFPLQTWSPEAQQDITSRALTFLKSQKYEKQANFDKVLPALGRVIKDSQLLTIVLVSSGDEKMRGTPFDDRINESYQKWHNQQQKARMPFVTALRAKNGQLAEFAVSTPPWPTQMPHLPQATQSAETIQSKLFEALHNAPPPTAPPLIVSGKKTQAEKTTAPKEEPGSGKVEAPAVAAAATSTNQPLAAKPPAPTIPPVAMAKTEAAPVTPDKPSTQSAPKPSPAPMPVTEPIAEAAKAKAEAALALTTPAPAPKPAAIQPPKPAPALESKPALATAPVPAPVPGPAPFPSSDGLPPASVPATPAQTATAVPAETSVSHRSIWIAGLVLAGVVIGFAFLLLHRSRPAPGASLITRSFERKKKP